MADNVLLDGSAISVIAYVAVQLTRAVRDERTRFYNNRNGGTPEDRSVAALEKLVVEEKRGHDLIDAGLTRLAAEHADHRLRLEKIGTDVTVIKDRK